MIDSRSGVICHHYTLIKYLEEFHHRWDPAGLFYQFAKILFLRITFNHVEVYLPYRVGENECTKMVLHNRSFETKKRVLGQGCI